MNAAWLRRWAGALWVGLKHVDLERACALVLVLGLGSVLGLAGYLDPSPLGHGTHQQLGLAGCSFLTLTGYACPMCGATTTFALMADLRWLEGFLNQPFAALLFCVTVCTFILSLWEVVQPRQRWSRVLGWLEPWELRVALGALAVMSFSWFYKLWQMA